MGEAAITPHSANFSATTKDAEQILLPFRDQMSTVAGEMTEQTGLSTNNFHFQ